MTAAIQRRPWRPAVEVVDLGGRVPPHNIDVEAAVLGHLLVRGASVLDDLADTLDASHWYADAHRRVYEAAIELHRAGRPVDVQTVAERLRERDEVQAVGGISALAKLLDSAPAIAHLGAYAETLVSLATKRRAIETLQIAAAEAFGDTGPTVEWLDGVEQRVHDLAPSRQSRGVVGAYDLMRDAWNRMNSTEVVGTTTGLVDLDRQLGGGMREGELLVIAARPGMGKTGLVANICASVAEGANSYDKDATVTNGLGAMLFSLEMPKEQMADRLLCAGARVSLTTLRTKAMSNADYDRLTLESQRLSKMPLWIDDTPAITLMELRGKVRRKQREMANTKLGVVIVDYLQLMRGDGDRREEEIASISRGLKQLAKELHVPVIALSQLNRAVETRSTKDKRPQLSDLRESGAIEQDADAILFIYRPEYYIADKESAEARKLRGYAEIIVAKQRNGPVGKVPVTFTEECVRFDNRASSAYQERDE